MSTIWIDRHSRLKSYSAAVKGSKSVVSIQIECDEPGSLGFLLEELGRIDREQREARKREAEEVSRSQKQKKPLALPIPALMLPYFGGRDE